MVNELYKITVILLIVAAIFMLMYAGFLYMTKEAVNAKGEAKNRIINIGLGLVVILSTVLIFNFINPDLLNVEPEIRAVSIEIEKNQFNIADQVESQAPYTISGTVSDGLQKPDFRHAINNNVKIRKFVVQGAEGSNNYANAYIVLNNGVTSGLFPVRLGAKGLTSNWSSGSKKTPIGTFTLGKKRYSYSKDGQEILTRSANKNGKRQSLGPAFISVEQDEYYGIGIHGARVGNRLSSTAGCVRVRNEDLIVFMKNFSAGVSKIEIRG